MTYVDAGALSDFEEGRITIVSLAGVEVGIANWRGCLYAVRNVCPHQAAPVCEGVLYARVGSAKVGSVSAASARPVIACPWHAWEFDAKSGKSLSDKRMHLRCYDVRTRAGRVEVDMGRRGVVA